MNTKASIIERIFGGNKILLRVLMKNRYY